MMAAPDRVRLTIRPMQIDDLEQVIAIDQEAFSLPWPAQAFHHELTQNSAAQLKVAEIELPGSERRVVGMIVVWLILDEAHVATFAIERQFRRRGIGRQLLAAALREAVDRGARSALLEVRAGNRAAQEMYADFGFIIVSRRLHYYKDNNEDALLLTSQLPRPADLDEIYTRWLAGERQPAVSSQ